ncbi:MAG: 8-amino-7-oxononanoate synthase [Nitratireductor sp.]
MAKENSLDAFVKGKLDALEKRALRRVLVETARGPAAAAERGGRKLVSFCCNDYLNLSQSARVKEAAKAAIDAYGAGSGASRHITGNHPLYTELETRLARLKETEDCVVFGSGYLANMGIVSALVGPGDLVLADELSHNCLMMGARLSYAETHIFRHNDLEHLTELLDAHRGNARHCMILTDGVFSMDGDLAPVREMGELARRYDAWLMTDDAHGIGVVADGKGSSFIGGTKADVPLQMGTLSKAVGGYGGYLCASRAVCDFIRTRARTLIYTTGLPPASVAAAIASIDIIESDKELTRRPVEKAKRFTRALNLPDPESPIVPVLLGDAGATLDASKMLEAEGFLVTGIRPPTVPEGTARLRITFTAEHEDADIDRLAAIIRERIMPKRAAE